MAHLCELTVASHVLTAIDRRGGIRGNANGVDRRRFRCHRRGLPVVVAGWLVARSLAEGIIYT